MARQRSESNAPHGVLAGRRPVLELLRAGKSAERILIAKGTSPAPVVSEIRKRADAAGIPTRFVPRAEIDRVASGMNHQGVAALTGRYRYAPMEGVLAGENPLVLFLDGITDPHNLGSLLRSADGAGFDGVVVPVHRAVGVTAAVRRVSAGAAEVMPVARVTNLSRAVDEAREAGLWVVAMDEKADEDLWTSKLLEPPLALVLGAEDRGISRGVRERCDGFVRIPSTGRLDSLNVAVAGALAMFEIARRRAPSVTL